MDEGRVKGKRVRIRGRKGKVEKENLFKIAKLTKL